VRSFSLICLSWRYLFSWHGASDTAALVILSRLLFFLICEAQKKKMIKALAPKTTTSLHSVTNGLPPAKSNWYIWRIETKKKKNWKTERLKDSSIDATQTRHLQWTKNYKYTYFMIWSKRKEERIKRNNGIFLVAPLGISIDELSIEKLIIQLSVTWNSSMVPDDDEMQEMDTFTTCLFELMSILQ